MTDEQGQTERNPCQDEVPEDRRVVEGVRVDDPAGDQRGHEQRERGQGHNDAAHVE